LSPHCSLTERRPTILRTSPTAACNVARRLSAPSRCSPASPEGPPGRAYSRAAVGGSALIPIKLYSRRRCGANWHGFASLSCHQAGFAVGPDPTVLGVGAFARLTWKSPKFPPISGTFWRQLCSTLGAVPPSVPPHATPRPKALSNYAGAFFPSAATTSCRPSSCSRMIRAWRWCGATCFSDAR
jgi:hypothetical protein